MAYRGSGKEDLEAGVTSSGPWLDSLLQLDGIVDREDYGDEGEALGSRWLRKLHAMATAALGSSSGWARERVRASLEGDWTDGSPRSVVPRVEGPRGAGG